MHLKMAAGRGLGPGLIESTAQQRGRAFLHGWLGPDHCALQKAEVRRESISECWECTSSQEGRTALIVRGPADSLAGL